MDGPATSAAALRASLANSGPPAGLSPALEALWWDGKGDWEAAHSLVQNDGSAAGSWVHAFLHRREGDLANAAYWYRRAGHPVARGPLADEWDAITASLLAES